MGDIELGTKLVTRISFFLFSPHSALLNFYTHTRMMDEKELELLYIQQLNEELILQTRAKINQLIQDYPHEFGLDSLFASNNKSTTIISMSERLAQLYQEICQQYNSNVIPFDHVWVEY